MSSYEYPKSNNFPLCYAPGAVFRSLKGLSRFNAIQYSGGLSIRLLIRYFTSRKTVPILNIIPHYK